MDKEITANNADELDVVMNNMLLRSKRQNNLLESKIEVLAIKKLQTEPLTITEKDAEGKNYKLDGVSLNASELKLLMNRDKSHSLYDQIRVAAARMMQKYVVIEEPKTHQFTYSHYYHKVSYNNGVMDITFEPEMGPYLKNISANYTKLSLPILWSFSTNGAFQLYVHLRSYVYKISEKPSFNVAQRDAETLVKEYNLAELRADLGYVELNADASEGVKIEAAKKHPDWEKISKLEKTPKYRRWSDFSSRVLKPGIKEINEKSDIYVSKMEPVKTGRGGKITGVKFYIQYNKAFFLKGASTEETRVVDDAGIVEEKYKSITTGMIAEIMSIFPEEEHLITPVEAEILYNDAKGDLTRIKDAYEYSKKVARIDNFIGFMRQAIRNNYAGSESVEVMNGSRKAAESYHRTMDNLEKNTDAFLASYWNKAKNSNSDKFMEFVKYLEDNGSDLDIFEGANNATQCGDRYMNWIKTGETDIF